VSSLIAYYPGKTFFHKLDPRAKIIFMVIVSSAIFMVQQIPVALVVLGVMVCLWFLARLPFNVLWSFIKVLLPIIGFLSAQATADAVGDDPIQHLADGAFAGAVLPHDGNELTLVDLQVQVSHHPARAARVAIGDVFELNGGCVYGRTPVTSTYRI